MCHSGQVCIDGLPGKPLKDIAGKPMVCRVYERAAQAHKVSRTLVATDDERILQAVREHGGEAMMTRKDHPTGTDRLAEVERPRFRRCRSHHQCTGR